MFKLFHNINKQKKEMIKEGKIEELQVCNNNCESINKIRQWQKELNDIEQEKFSPNDWRKYVKALIEKCAGEDIQISATSTCSSELNDFIHHITFTKHLEKGFFQRLGIELDKVYDNEILIYKLKDKIKHEKEILGIK